MNQKWVHSLPGVHEAVSNLCKYKHSEIENGSTSMNLRIYNTKTRYITRDFDKSQSKEWAEA